MNDILRHQKCVYLGQMWINDLLRSKSRCVKLNRLKIPHYENVNLSWPSKWFSMTQGSSFGIFNCDFPLNYCDSTELLNTLRRAYLQTAILIRFWIELNLKYFGIQICRWNRQLLHSCYISGAQNTGNPNKVIVPFSLMFMQ